MNKKIRLSAFLILFCFLLGILLTASVQAQLILENMKVKIVKVDKVKNRLEVRVHDGGNKDVQYVLIDGNTKFSHKEKPVSLARAWQTFKPGMMIRVKGGITWDLKLKAKYIYW